MTDYFLGDALGSVRQLTNTAGEVTYAKSYDPYGVVTQTSGEGQSAWGYSGEQQSNDMVYLRSRYYNAADGRFQSRDTWGGDANRPMSLNRWMYVEGNPVNLIDPTGYSSCALGTCGPDVTDWFMQQMKLHYEGGREVKSARDAMRAKAASTSAFFGKDPILLSHLLIDTPSQSTFGPIMSGWTYPGTSIPIGTTPVFNNSTAIAMIDALGFLEYGLYGLAVDYGRIDFKTSALTECVMGFCSFLPGGKRTVTLCGHCIDSSDMGNMMFGLGGQARGYPLGGVYPSALAFNILTAIGVGDLSTLNITDGLGVVPGYLIASTQAFNSQKSFCQIINMNRPIGYNDNVALADSQAPNYRSVTADDIKRKGQYDYSSLYRWSDDASTLTLLKGHLSFLGY